MNPARAGLLLLLPAMAAALYLDGQRFDTSAFRYSPGGGGGRTLFAREAAGLLMEGAPRVYSRENLFERVNGHAEFFISLGFKSLAAADYSPAGAAAGKPEYTAEIYDMGAPENAFGVLAQESSGMETADMGAMGFSSSMSRMFIQGDYYVKVDSFGPGDKLETLTRAIAGLLPESPEGLPQFADFPKEGSLKNGRSFRREDYMGLDFIRGVFEQEYERDGGRFFAFKFRLEEGDEAFMKKAEAALNDLGASVARAQFAGSRGLAVADKYEGPWAVAFVKGQALGARGLPDKDALARFMDEFVKKAGGS